jgi:hypothetical protein
LGLAAAVAAVAPVADDGDVVDGGDTTPANALSGTGRPDDVARTPSTCVAARCADVDGDDDADDCEEDADCKAEAD